MSWPPVANECEKVAAAPAAMTSIANVVMTATLVRRMKFRHWSKTGLWQKAYNNLSLDVKQELDFQGINSWISPLEIIAIIEERKNDVVRRQWKYTRSNGEEVVLREVFEKIAGWLDKFKAVGDVAVQFDPTHAGLPWAAVRFFLQAAVNDVQVYGAMMEALELVSRIITRYAEIERKDLHGSSTMKTQLTDAIVRLYGVVLSFFAKARRYYEQKTGVRIAKSILSSQMSIVGHIERITKEEDDVYKLVFLVEMEDQKNRLTSMHRAVSGIQESLATPSMPMEDRRHRVLQWLEPVFTDDKFDNAKSSRHEKTCNWILERPQFTQWAEAPTDKSKILWVYGPPGFGKTVLAARLIEDLSERHPIANFFCVSESENKREPYAVLKSWIAQMVQQSDVAVEAAEKIYKHHEIQAPTISELWQLFQNICHVMTGSIFVVDGFDECTHINTIAKFHTDDAREQFLIELLKALLSVKAQILIVSRDNVDIRTSLTGESVDKSLITLYEYEITQDDTMNDITSFSNCMIDKKLPKKSQALRKEIARDAAEKSEGMFLWLTLLKAELQPGKNAKQLRKTLSEMPAGIEQAYEKDLDRIVKLSSDKRERAIAVLRWILFAVRPLSVRELCEAMALTFDDTKATYPEDDLPDSWGENYVDEDYVNDFIKEPCGSLVVLHSQDHNETLALHTVHFVHFSVKEYLLRPNEAGQLRAQAICFPNNSSENDKLAQLCLQYLCYDVFGEDPVDVDDSVAKRLQVYPFLTYAARYWYDHASKVEKESTDITHYAKKLFDPSTSNWHLWSQVFDAEIVDSESSDSDDDEIFRPPDPVQEYADTGNFTRSPIYYASLLGLTDIILALHSEGIQLNVSGGRFGSPLQAAIANGQQAAVKLLLGEGADVAQEGGEYGYAIIAAAASGSETIFDILVAAGADINVTDNKGRTCLHFACSKGAIAIAKSLIDKDAKVDALNEYGESPLFFAGSSGHDEIVNMLLEHNADPNIRTKYGIVPLYIAILHKREAVVFTLLRRGANVQSPRFNGITCLHLAAEMGDSNIVKELLTNKAEIDAVNNGGWTPLHSATNSGKTSTVKLLLENGAGINNTSTEGWTALHVAAEYSDEATMKVLLEYGANVNAENSVSWTPLHTSLRTSSLPVIRLLLENGANPSIHDINGDTILDEAISRSNSEVIMTLLKYGALDRSPGRRATTLRRQVLSKLHKASYLGQTKVVEELLADVTMIEDESQLALDTALHAAALAGQNETALFLLDKGATINYKGANDREALHLAAASGFLELVKTLLGRGAHVKGGSDDGAQPLNLAVRHGVTRFETINLLIQHGALDETLPPPSESLFAVDNIRHSIALFEDLMMGEWAGTYTYLKWRKGTIDATGFSIVSTVTTSDYQLRFSGGAKDLAGEFEIHGQLNGSSAWFVKLYETTGWLYYGNIDVSTGKMTGYWGRKKEVWDGTFELTRKREAEHAD